MNKNTTDITLSAYFNDIVIGYYEDEDLVKQFGRQLGFDVDMDTFMAVSFQYPSDMNVKPEDREKLTNAANAIIALSDINKKIGGKQIITCDSGDCVILIMKDKSAMRDLIPQIKETALQEVEKISADRKIGGKQIITCDSGDCVILVMKDKSAMRDLIPQIKETALQEVEKIESDRKIRVGIGTIESGIKGIKHTYSNAQDAVKAGEIFKKDRVILEYMGMEIYSSINQMVVNFGDRLTRTVLKQLGETEKRVLAKYYKCKEDIAETARQLGMSEDDVKTSLNMVRINTGLDVNDTEDNFKLHFIMIAKKVLENDERIKKNR